VPFVHDAPRGHWTPHPLQASGFVCRFTQAPLQSVSAAPASSVPQFVAHVPLLHTGVPASAAQTAPQLPQFNGSLWVCRQTFPHRIPLKHWHVPAWQVVPAPHRVLQPPQLALFELVSTQAFPHRARPAGQAHAPIVHVMPGPHVTPQAPQLFVSLWSGMHAPLQ
jgi:hypothetical protein